MKLPALAALVLALLTSARAAAAHPAPFSYLDVRVEAGAVEIAVTAHVFDLAHDLQIAAPERLLEPAFLAEHSDAVVALLRPRLQFGIEGRAAIEGVWSAAEPLPDRQSVTIRARYDLDSAPGTLMVDARMFPYDPAHQTFVTVYEGDRLTFQAILNQAKTLLEYYPGSRQGVFAVARRFLPAGLEHVLLGPDHLVLLVGLLLLGGSAGQLVLLGGALVAGDALAFLLTTLNLLHPPARIIEPVVALGIVYVGADNLMVRGGRDTRIWMAFALGLIHGFWFANGLRAMDLPPRALAWSLVSFDLGLEMAQLLVIAIAGAAIVELRRRHGEAGRRLAYAGSAAAIAAGTFWFIQRVFFPGGIA